MRKSKGEGAGTKSLQVHLTTHRQLTLRPCKCLPASRFTHRFLFLGMCLHSLPRADRGQLAEHLIPLLFFFFQISLAYDGNNMVETYALSLRWEKTSGSVSSRPCWRRPRTLTETVFRKRSCIACLPPDGLARINYSKQNRGVECVPILMLKRYSLIFLRLVSY